MKSWIHRLFAAPTPAAVSALDPMPAAAAPRLPVIAPATPGDAVNHEVVLLAWIAGGAAFAVGPAGPREYAALQRLDQLIADTTAHPRLLPRAAAVIPPLLARLRNPVLSMADLSDHVSRDMTLVSEIIRMANSAHYRSDATIVELDQALRVLGIEGLRGAIARAVLKPLISAASGRLAASSAARLWEHTDRKAQLSSALARGMGFEAFEGCLAALAHNAVWSTVLRTMDEIDGERPWRLSPGFVEALGARRNRLFAIVAHQWLLDIRLAQSVTEMVDGALAPDATPATHLLYTADRLAWCLCSPDRSRAADMALPVLQEADASVRACYLAFDVPCAEEALAI